MASLIYFQQCSTLTAFVYLYLNMANVFYFQFNVPFFDKSLCGHLDESGPVYRLGDLYILPKFATVSTSTGLPCISVAWGGVEQWLDRNPKGTYQVSCKFRKYLKKKCNKI